jgi:Linalool dehydratase/isomerase
MSISRVSGVSDQTKDFQPPVHDAPITRSRLRRTRVVYALMVLGGAALLLTGSGFWAATGVGLWFPGAGFLATGGWWTVFMPVVLFLFALSLIAWFGAGFNTLPPTVWLGSALLAGWAAGASVSRTGVVIAAAVLVVGHVAAQLVFLRSRKAMARRRQRRLEYLPAAMATAAATATAPPSPESLELDPETLAALRYVFDRALQDPADFSGYDKIDQFQTAAYRYQINYLGYALAVTQAHYAPNFHGYLAHAQRKLIDKYLDHRVWQYWALENAWGNLRLNPDPVGKDNIMLTGYFGLQVGLYTALTGDQRYLRPGGLTFGKYQHSLHTIADSLMMNFRKAPFGLFPCEPNWVYTACNFRGAGALQVYDRITGSHNFDEIAHDFRNKLESEFVHADFSMVALKSKHTGFNLPFPVPDALPSVYLNSMFPDIAQRYWAIARAEAFADEGGLKPVLPRVAIDAGNYKPGYALAMEAQYGAAREFGDTAAADAAKRALDTLCDPVTENGVFRYRKGSNFINACVILDRQLQHNFWRQTVLGPTPESALSGPILDDVDYPDVLVAKALSDGDDLRLVLYPGGPAGRQRLRLARLQPGRPYHITGAVETSVNADSQGRAEISVLLGGRTEVRLAPSTDASAGSVH